MDYNKAALELHSKFPGKIAVQSLCECKDRDALSTAYTPGVAEPCRKIKANPDDVYTYTMKGRTVAVVTNGTAVLGLGNIGPEAGLPVMEGKCVLFKEFGGVDAFPICLNAKTKEAVIAAVKAIAPTFGGINLEDIRSPECFEIEAELERDLDIPVFHDDQHGTAIIVLAGVLNALKVVGKRIEDVKIVQNGPGAAGTAIIHMLQVAGAKNIVAVDEHGILYPNRPAGLEGHKGRLAEETNPDKLTGGLAEAIRDADIFIGTSIAGALTPELAATMAKEAIVFAMANPTPEIMPDLAKQAGVRVIGTGRSDFPNQINNDVTIYRTLQEFIVRHSILFYPLIVLIIFISYLFYERKIAVYVSRCKLLIYFFQYLIAAFVLASTESILSTSYFFFPVFYLNRAVELII